MAIGGNFSKPGMGSGAQAPLPSGGMQGGSATLQQNIQQRVPNQGQFNGNPRGVYNTNFRGQGNAPSYMQQTNLGRYVPPTMSDGGRFGFNSNQWNNFGGYDYNLPGSYGSPQGGGQFAPMPGQFAQYMNPNMLSGNTFGFGNLFGGRGGGINQGGQRMDDFDQRAQLYYSDPQRYEELYMSQPQYTTQIGAGGGSPYQGRSGQWYEPGMAMSASDFAPRTLRERIGQGGQQGGFSMEAINADPQGFRDWAAMALSAPQQTPEFAAEIRNQLRMMGPAMPPGKDGRPLQTGFAPMPGPRAPRDNRAGPMMEDIPAYDRPENRSYNMNALYQMMGGF